MKSAVYSKAGQVGLVEVERPQIKEADDVIIRIVRTCVCGSDLWTYRNPKIKEGRLNKWSRSYRNCRRNWRGHHNSETRGFCHCTIYSWLWGM